MSSLSLIIWGEAASKSNSRRHVTINGKSRSIKSQKALDFEASAVLQITGNSRVGWEGPLRIDAVMYYASRRPDLDFSLVQDILQNVGVYKNDRQIVELHLYKRLDPVDPRVEVKITQLDI